MPSLGADMKEGRVVQWLVHPGDEVQRGDIVAVVDTEKAEVDVEVWETGVISELVVPEGEKVPVGTVLALLDVPGVATATGAVPEEPVTRETKAPIEATPREREPAAPRPSPTAVQPREQETGRHRMPSGARRRVSPLARRVAEQLGIDVEGVPGTGLGGAVTKADIERAAAGVAETPSAALIEPPAAPGTPRGELGDARDDRAAAMRRAIAAAMSRSHAEIPHYYVGGAINMHRAVQWLAEQNRGGLARERIVYSALLLRAVALAAREVPEMNGAWVDDSFAPSEQVHLGVAIALPRGGLLAPAIHDADRGSVRELMDSLRDLVRRARSGSLRGSELTDATLTVTSLGEHSADTVHGLIYPPQVALVGFGSLVERPWAEDGALSARLQVHATVAADHRASDGRSGGRFLRLIDRLLQEPERL